MQGQEADALECSTPAGLSPELFRPLVEPLEAFALARVFLAAAGLVERGRTGAAWEEGLLGLLRGCGAAAWLAQQVLANHAAEANRKGQLLLHTGPAGALPAAVRGCRRRCCWGVFRETCRALGAPGASPWLHAAFAFMLYDTEVMLCVSAHETLEECCAVLRALFPGQAHEHGHYCPFSRGG